MGGISFDISTGDGVIFFSFLFLMLSRGLTWRVCGFREICEFACGCRAAVYVDAHVGDPADAGQEARFLMGCLGFFCGDGLVLLFLYPTEMYFSSIHSTFCWLKNVRICDNSNEFYSQPCLKHDEFSPP